MTRKIMSDAELAKRFVDFTMDSFDSVKINGKDDYMYRWRYNLKVSNLDRVFSLILGVAKQISAVYLVGWLWMFKDYNWSISFTVSLILFRWSDNLGDTFLEW